MIIRCLHADAGNLSRKYLEPRAGLTNDTVFPLTPGREYVVVAVSMRQDLVWYFIHDDHALEYPLRYPGPLFDLVSARVSPEWEFAYTPKHADHAFILAIGPWARDQFFYDRLTDGEAATRNVYNTARENIQKEAKTTPRFPPF